MIKSSPRPSNIRRGRCGRIRNVEQLTRLKLSECLLKASLNAFAHAKLPHSRAFALRSRSTKRPDGSCYPPMAVCVAGLVLGLHFVRRPSDVISSGHCWFGFDFSCASGPNLTFRFAWAFSGGLACASLKNARANQHSIECRRPQRACDGGGQPQRSAEARLARQNHPPRPTAGTAEIMRGPANPSRWYGDGRRGSWRRALRADARQDARAQTAAVLTVQKGVDDLADRRRKQPTGLAGWRKRQE